MSVVLERVETTKSKIYDKAMSDIDEMPLSKALRGGTWTDHERVRHSPFEMALVEATVPEDAYADYMAQAYYIYSALEEKAEEYKNDPVAGNVIQPELNRKKAIEADLAFFYGDDWADKIQIMPITKEYVARIKASSPVTYVAQHYTRYLADLSGGLMIYSALKKAWDRGDDGLRYYVFEGINALPFKKQYRETLDNLPLDKTQKWDLIEESLIAYEFNAELTAQLTDRYLAKA